MPFILMFMAKIFDPKGGVAIIEGFTCSCTLQQYNVEGVSDSWILQYN